MKRMRCLLYLSFGLFAVSLSSCEKFKEMYRDFADKVKEESEKGDGKKEELSSQVSVVREAEGKKIIDEEKRLVILEFYSDT